jgi:hypothetical protein
MPIMSARRERVGKTPHKVAIRDEGLATGTVQMWRGFPRLTDLAGVGLGVGDVVCPRLTSGLGK